MNASRPTWDETWMEVARVVARRSLCVRDRIGAIVVSRSNRIIDTGYNGPARGFVMDRVDTPCTDWCPRAQLQEKPRPEYEDCMSVHAEANALLFGDRTQREGGTLYVTSNSCAACAKLIANSGLEQVIVDLSSTPEYRHDTTWIEFMEKCGLTVVTL